MLNGMINVYKEKGYTSHDVVNRLRRVLGQKKIGHTGTLDPQAEGVLPVCLGSGTKLCDLFVHSGKEYRAVLLLGVITDTQDTTGTVLQTQDVPEDEEAVRRAVMSFAGTYEQVPPMYSAVKINGRKLYEFARKGIEVERKSRQVTIDSIDITDISLPRLTITVSCSKGTYIRTLCEDIGRKIGCGGCLESLVRTRTGTFSIDSALRIDAIEQHVIDGTIGQFIIPVDAMFPDAARASVAPSDDLYLHNGNPFHKRDLHLEKDAEFTEYLRLYDSLGEFMGLYVWENRRQLYKPEKMFLPF